jgi:pimeloyl-ACP methyl ester carboxylesterase
MTANFSPWTHQFVETNRIRLHYITQGAGELVILLHGFPEFWYSWRYQIPVLAQNFKVVVPDLRGYNDSDKPQTGYDLETLTQDVVGLIQRLGYTKAHIVGHDCGGTIAWNLAQRFPSYLSSLSILNAPHPTQLIRELTRNGDQLLRSWYWFALQLPGFSDLWIRNNLPEFVRNWFQHQAIRKAAFSREVLAMYAAALAKTGAIAAATQYYRQFLNPTHWLGQVNWNDLPVQIPTLVLWGEDDAILSPALMQGMESFIQAPFRLKSIPDCGHWIQQEVPRLVNSELLAFLNQQSRLEPS